MFAVIIPARNVHGGNPGRVRRGIPGGGWFQVTGVEGGCGTGWRAPSRRSDYCMECRYAVTSARLTRGRLRVSARP